MIFFLQIISKHLTGHTADLLVSAGAARWHWTPLADTQAASSWDTIGLWPEAATELVCGSQPDRNGCNLPHSGKEQHFGTTALMTVYTLAFTWRAVSGPGREKSCASTCLWRLNLEQHATLKPTLCLAQADIFWFSSIQHRAEPHSMWHNFIWKFLRLQSWSWDTIYQMSQHPELSLGFWENFSIKKIYAREHMIWFNIRCFIW